MQVLSALARDASPGLVRLCGSFTTKSDGTPINTRPSKGEFTVTRKAAGVYVVKFNQPCMSLVWADAWLGYASAVVSTNNTVSLGTAELGVVNTSADFMSSDGTHYSTETTNTSFLVLVYNAASNHTSLTLTDIYGLTVGNTSSKANARCMFEAVYATSAMNF